MLIIHDFFQITGGGERLISELAKKINCKVFTVSKSGIYKENPRIIEYGNQFLIKYFKKLYFFLFYLLFFKAENINDDEVVLFSGSYSILNVEKFKSKKKIAYVHSLPKKIYNDKYSSNLEIWILPFSFILKKIYKRKFNKFNTIIFNSHFTKNIFLENIKINDSIKLEVIYPFFDEKFNFSKSNDFEFKDNYFLFNSRHEKNKRVHQIVNFFSKNKDYNLVLTNNGSLTKILKYKYGSSENIFFAENISDTKYLDILKNSLAVLMVPIYEDFGMAALESIACNKPVIASREGGLIEILGDNYKYYIDTEKFEISLKEKILKLKNDKFKVNFNTELKMFELNSFVNKLMKIINY